MGMSFPTTAFYLYIETYHNLRYAENVVRKLVMLMRECLVIKYKEILNKTPQTLLTTMLCKSIIKLSVKLLNIIKKPPPITIQMILAPNIRYPLSHSTQTDTRYPSSSVLQKQIRKVSTQYSS